nr:TPA_asm: m170l iORF 1 RNA 1 [Murid betaherpesvirus 1]DBA08154.1 TPA_asm: m170l iORF 1 RNA 1 [Murid betaherpesvirus 1]
MPVVTRRR